MLDCSTFTYTHQSSDDAAVAAGTHRHRCTAHIYPPPNERHFPKHPNRSTNTTSTTKDVSLQTAKQTRRQYQHQHHLYLKASLKPAGKICHQKARLAANDSTHQNKLSWPIASKSRPEAAVACDTPMGSLAVASQCTRESTVPIEKLLGIFELCEQVINNLSMNDILHAMQACRAFKSNVENSTKLQMKLFLAPDYTRQNRTAISSTHTLLSGAKAAEHIVAIEAAGGPSTGEFVLYTPHPAIQLHEREGDIKRVGLVLYAAFRVGEKYTSGDGAIRASIMSLANIWYKPTSLENMFLTQPPTKAVGLSDGHLGYWSEKKEVFAETGVTFGDIFRAMRAVTRQGESLPHLLSFGEGIVASAKVVELAEIAGELPFEDDPTRWVPKDGEFVLKEGEFEFL
ncbi:hypothetical protein Q7P35_004121 [Cladosporium inversicolor]